MRLRAASRELSVHRAAGRGQHSMKNAKPPTDDAKPWRRGLGDKGTWSARDSRQPAGGSGQQSGRLVNWSRSQFVEA